MPAQRCRSRAFNAPGTRATTVILRIRQRLGNNAGLTRSVISNMLRKLLVTSIRTIKIGVMIAVPVTPSAIARKSHHG